GLLGCNGTVGGHGSGTAGSGTITGTGGASGGAGGTAAAPTPADMFGTCPAGGGEPGVSPLIKLSTIQYRNTVRDLLGASGLADVATEVAPMLAAIPDDSSTVAFSGLDTRVSSDHIQGYFNVASAVAD